MRLRSGARSYQTNRERLRIERPHTLLAFSEDVLYFPMCFCYTAARVFFTA